MNYEETLNYIHSLGNFGKPATLERIKAALQSLGSPQNGFKSIHIAGTNGKGSVSLMLAEIFKTAGYKTGLFISPYVIDFNERIQINGAYISKEDLVYYAKRVMDTKIPLTEFEFITATAFLYFAEQKIDVLICETGLGGRLDATNTLENKSAALITKIGLDHTAILGDTIEKITAEKCGIIKNCPTITSPCQKDSVFRVIKAKDKNVIIPKTEEAEIKKSDITGNTFIYKGREYETSLCGEHQIENALIVIETVMGSSFDISYKNIYNGIKNTVFPARLEVISVNPLVILDGAHNPDGAECLGRVLRKYSGNVTAIVGMMKDKDIDGVLKHTLIHCKNAVAVTVPDIERSLSADELCNKASKYCNAVKAKNLQDAVNLVGDNSVTAVFGSLYLASKIRPLLFKKFRKI